MHIDRQRICRCVIVCVGYTVYYIPVCLYMHWQATHLSLCYSVCRLYSVLYTCMPTCIGRQPICRYHTVHYIPVCLHALAGNPSVVIIQCIIYLYAYMHWQATHLSLCYSVCRLYSVLYTCMPTCIGRQRICRSVSNCIILK